VALSKAFALAAASDEARSIREEVGFFQAIRAALIKSAPGDGKRSTAERELAIQQIVSRAVVSTEIVDIMRAAGLESPDISILSDEFLAEVRNSDKKNLAIEALKKLINGDVRSQSKHNVTQFKAFTERLEAAIARYHANALTTAQVLEELLALAKDIRAARSPSWASRRLEFLCPPAASTGPSATWTSAGGMYCAGEENPSSLGRSEQ
jgi:type I restriction enzyme R subunit